LKYRFLLTAGFIISFLTIVYWTRKKYAIYFRAYRFLFSDGWQPCQRKASVARPGRQVPRKPSRLGRGSCLPAGREGHNKKGNAFTGSAAL